MRIIAIDPGNIESAFVIVDVDTYAVIEKGKVKNEELLESIKSLNLTGATDYLAVEMIASYGMSVGQTIFDTCVWIGRYTERYDKDVTVLYRKEIKMNLCGSTRAKDSNIRQALIDRFGVVGTKNNQGWFYGFKSDIWSAYAVAVTWLDWKKGYNNEQKQKENGGIN